MSLLYSGRQGNFKLPATIKLSAHKRESVAAIPKISNEKGGGKHPTLYVSFVLCFHITTQMILFLCYLPEKIVKRLLPPNFG